MLLWDKFKCFGYDTNIVQIFKQAWGHFFAKVIGQKDLSPGLNSQANPGVQVLGKRRV